MAGKKKNFTPEFRDEASREVVDNSRSIASVARGIGVSETTLGNWVRAYRERHAGEEPPLELSERARLREAEREVRELRQKVTFLEKVAAYFASEQQWAASTRSSQRSTPPIWPRRRLMLRPSRR